MKILRILSVIALVLAVCGNAGAAVTLRTAPFPGSDVFSGTAFCVARNGGTTDGQNVKMTMFRTFAPIALSTDTRDPGPDETERGTSHNLQFTSPSWCECSVPNATVFTCSFVYVNGAFVTVVPGP